MADDAAEGESGPQTVKIISSDGYEFIVERDAAMVSGTIKNMLSSPGEKLTFDLGPLTPRSRPRCCGTVGVGNTGWEQERTV